MLRIRGIGQQGIWGAHSSVRPGIPRTAGWGGVQREARNHTRRALSSSATNPVASEGSPILEGASKAVSEASTSAQPLLFEPLVPYLSSLPDLLHLPEGSHKYALSIFLGTFLLRSLVTLPVTIWQRKRTRKMVEVVGPQWERIKEQLPPKIRARSRRAGLSYESFQKELQTELRKELRILTQRNKCTPLPTFLLPLAVNVPLFIGVSMLLRTSLLLHEPSGLANELIPWWAPPAELQQRFDASAKILAARGIEGEALAQLTKMHGPTLQEVDRTMLGPIGLGIALMANVELGQYIRKSIGGKFTSGGQKTEEEERGHKRTGKLTDDGKEIVMVDLGVMRESFIGNSLRALSIVFVAIASQAPTGLIVYWLSSACFTFIQNIALELYERTRAKKKVQESYTD